MKSETPATKNSKKGTTKVRVTQKGTGEQAIIDATPDLIETLKTNQRRGRPPKVTKPKTAEQIAADIDEELVKVQPIIDKYNQLKTIADILRGV